MATQTLTPTLRPPHPYVWSRDEYDHLVELGIFDGKHVELLEGELIQMAPIGSAHATAVTLAVERLMHLFGPGYVVRGQMTLDLGLTDQPEPDVAVVPGPARAYTDHHPTSALLVVEVADSSLAYDRTRKVSLYARAGIADYWIVNLPDHQLEVYRRPSPTGYREHTIYTAGDTVHPLAAPEATLAVDDLLL